MYHEFYKTTMKITRLQVNESLCGDCSLALKRFIEGINGVDAVDMGNLAISIQFDESVIDESKIQSIAKDNVERLGYRIEE
jgi:copper chaperone CopZ